MVKKIQILFLLFTVWALSFNTLNAQWIHTNGPKAPDNVMSITGIKKENGGFNLLAGANGVYVSTDYGTNWVKASGINGQIWTFFAFSGNNIFVGVWGSGIYESTDYGLNWTLLKNAPYFYTTSISTVSVNGIDTTLFAGGFLTIGENGSLYKSTDNGTSWQFVNNVFGHFQQGISGVASVDTNLFLDTYGNGIFISTDGGTSWDSTNTGLTNRVVNDLAVIDSNLFAGTLGGGVFESTDNGANWHPVNNGLTNLNVYNLFVNGTKLYAGTSEGGIYLSTNMGANWKVISSGRIRSDVNDIFVYQDTMLFAATDSAGVYRSLDNGKTWSNSITGEHYFSIRSLINSGNEIIAGEYLEGSGVFPTTDYGNNWIQKSKGIATSNRALKLAVNSGGIFAGTPNGIYKSTDNCSTWVEDTTGIGHTYIYSFAVKDSNIFAGTYGSYIYLSTDNGSTWTQEKNGLTNNGTIYSLAFHANKVYAGTLGGGVFVSTDMGSSWTEDTTGMGNQGLTALYSNGKYLFAGASSYYYASVYISTDDGTSWNINNNSIFFSPDSSESFIIYSITGIGSNVFIGTAGSGLFVSTDNGTTWKSTNDGLTDLNIFALHILNDTLYAGTKSGVWKLPLGNITNSVALDQEKIPSHFLLSRNYPNPFNPTTTINFSVPKSGIVTIKIYDILGREIKTLVSEEKAAGNYNIQFDGSRLPSGVYFYRMQAGDFVQTKKLVLLK